MARHYLKAGFLVIALLFAFRSDAQKTPLEFNDFVASITDSLFRYGGEWGEIVKGSFSSNDYSVLTPKRKSMEQFVDRQIAMLSTKKDIKKSAPLRLAMIDFLKYEKMLITTAMKPFENLSASSTEADRNKAIDDLTRASSGEEAQLQKVRAEQAVYAKDNGFTLEAEAEEEK